jgi:two-component system KDP operon response regulator KdpE
VWSSVPIIVLSADGSEDRKVDALDDGADDYMTKPFGMRELDARVRVALRHQLVGEGDQEELDVGSLHLDLVHCETTFEGRSVDLTPKEFEFLAYLARNAGKVCTRRMILEHVWGPAYAKESHYLKVYAYRIRRKLGDDAGSFVQSDPAVGYRLAATDRAR